MIGLSKDEAIGYALLETEHLPGFARRGPGFRLRLQEAGYVVISRDELPEPYKLEMLATWLDMYDKGLITRDLEVERGQEVQADLRRWAQSILKALEDK